MTALRLVVVALVVLPVLAFVVYVAARRALPRREWPIRFDGFPPRRYSWRVHVHGFDSGRRKYRPYA